MDVYVRYKRAVGFLTEIFAVAGVSRAKSAVKDVAKK